MKDYIQINPEEVWNEVIAGTAVFAIIMSELSIMSLQFVGASTINKILEEENVMFLKEL